MPSSGVISKGHLRVLEWLKPYAEQGEPADFPTIAEGMGIKLQTLRHYVSGLLRNQLLYRAGPVRSHKFALKRPRAVYDDEPERANAVPARYVPSGFIQEPSRERLMGRRA